MAKKTKAHSKKRSLLIAILVTVVIVLALSLNNALRPQSVSNNTPPVAPISNLQTHHSNVLNISIDVPNDLIVKEKFGQITLEKNGEIIAIHWIGTNKKYKDIQEYLDDAFSKNDDAVSIKKKELAINNYNALVVFKKYLEKPNKNNKAYYIHINDGFYHLYTYSPDLYAELDQVAKSFRYTP